MSNSISYLPDQEKIKKRFNFIDDPILLENITIHYRYIIFLINLDIHPDIPPVIQYSIRKDMIVNIAAIVESCTYYVVSKYLSVGRIVEKDVMPYEWKEEKCTILGMIDSDKQACGIVRRKRFVRFNQHTSFNITNDICINKKIFTPTIWNYANSIRKSRNKIHLAGLGVVDDVYTKEQVNECIDKSSKIIRQIEKKLEELKST